MNKAERAEAAQQWLNTLQSSKYQTVVENAIENTIYVPAMEALRFAKTTGDKDTYVSVYKNDVSQCVRASVRNNEGRTCVLDFASYIAPGGGFRRGAMAQEEAMCSTSALALCLESKMPVYKTRRESDISPLYDNDYIYVKACPFIINGKVYLSDVLALAAPNASKVNVPADVLYERMKVAYLTPAKHNCNNVVLGAFGCGVFNNDPQDVANNWKKLISTYHGLYDNVAFAVTDKDMYKLFKDTLTKGNKS